MPEVFRPLSHEGQINPSLTYADAIEWAEYALAEMDALKGEKARPRQTEGGHMVRRLQSPSG